MSNIKGQKIKNTTRKKEAYKYLITSALVDEMEAFYKTDTAFAERVPSINMLRA